MSTTKSSMGRRERVGVAWKLGKGEKLVCMYASIFLYASKRQINDAPIKKSLVLDPNISNSVSKVL